MHGGPTSFRWERLPSCRRGYFGLVKHAEQVRYVPREALAKTPFWIVLLIIFVAQKNSESEFLGRCGVLESDTFALSLRVRLLEPAQILACGCIGRRVTTR